MQRQRGDKEDPRIFATETAHKACAYASMTESSQRGSSAHRRPTRVHVVPRASFRDLCQIPKPMTKCILAPGVLPERVHVSAAQQQVLIDMADSIVAETLQTYESFVISARQLPHDQWKHVKTKEKVHVFRSRRGKPHSQSHDEKDPSRPRLLSATAMEQAAASGRPPFYDDDPVQEEENSINTHSSSSDAGSFSLLDDSVLADIKPSHVPLVVATGSIDGTVEDVAFGAVANTKRRWLERNLYVKNDVFDDRKLLATLQMPSQEDPFRSIVIKWATANFGPFMTRRDFLYLESMGMAFDSDGERVFYNLIHSIQLDECPSLDRLDIIRANTSICYIVRQLSSDSVELFSRGFAELRGEMMESHGIAILGQNVASCVGVVECSNLKKLSWLMSRRRRSDASGIAPTSACGVCHKSLKSLGSLLQTPSGCPSCRRVTCSKCSVQKKLTVDTSKGITLKSLSFCLSCVIEARELSAWEVATACLESS
ncbi:hypothetical protein PC118_g14599 [Phytophthora cactorum]|uniref:START-like domain n=2 Tax=Phytophthora cactorum TaxID=29920 RepID=A0A329RSA1_9STRA|nr:hypothetical protein PC111_g14903 [Phytophthora cactorum]KAG2852645.1 hypothetical protein PC113_g14846 [Phytophthora cactorum]KAG2906372.1 hypothetical protein PC115_g14316 [Phytophthora cactorum]KAG2974312.1 hypothetical protein PC118_g14599 [Phytophthora cactorum]KAG3004862.1 hypothetical protein PC119_g15479 [Phytophthora cactorum]